MANFTPEELEEILQQFFDVTGKRQYIGARYVPIFGRKDETSIEWDNSKPYEPLTIVLYQGNSYTSRTYVPIGVGIDDTHFWANTGNYNAQVEQYRRETAAVKEQVDATDALIPKTEFDSTNTVKNYIDMKTAVIKAQVDATDALIPKTEFDSTNTVKNYIDDADKKRAIVFNTVNDMKSSDDIFVGCICHTLGFYNLNDSGESWYVISNTGTPNDMDIIECNNNLLAIYLPTGDYISPEKFGCIVDSTCDTDKMEHLITYASDNNLVVNFVNDFNIQFVPNSTIANPTRIKVENKENVYIDGRNVTVNMLGLTKAYLESIDDNNSSGRDIFSLLAFHNCSHVVVKNINIIGTNAPDAQNKFRFVSPRSICVAFKHCTNCYVENVNGKDILGNVVNATTDDSKTYGCSNIIVSNCNAYNCYENGFNFMGGTTNSIIIGCISVRCSNGLEVYGSGCFAVSCTAIDSHTKGMLISGGASLHNCVVKGSNGTPDTYGIGIAVTAGDNNKVCNCIVQNCIGFALQVYPTASNTTIEGCEFIDNSKDTKYDITISVQGSADTLQTGLVLKDNIFRTTYNKALSNFTYQNGSIFEGNIFIFPNRNAYVAAFSSNSDGVVFVNNIFTSDASYNVTLSPGNATNFLASNNVINGALS